MLIVIDCYVNLNGDLVAGICGAVGIRPGVETEGYQVQYRGKNMTISVWAKEAVSVERFVTEESKDYNNDLVITSVRPAVKRGVSVLVTSLSFNIPDGQVIDYI